MCKLIFLIVYFYLISNNTFSQSAGNSILLDGTDDFLEVPHNTSLNPGNGSWSIVMWVKPVFEVRRSPLVTKRQPSGSYDQYSLGFADNDPHNPVPGKKIYYNYIDEVGVSERSGISTEDQLDSIWIHIAIVADKSKDSIYLYKNGVLQNYNLMYRYGSWPNIDNANDLFIGHNNMSHYYHGQMDELSIWNKALSLDQINFLIADTLSRVYYSVPDSGVVGYWRFDMYEDLEIGSSGVNDIRDMSYWQNHGDANGNPLLIPSSIPIGITNLGNNIPSNFYLYQNYPNPFNPTTKIKFSTPLNPPFGKGGEVRNTRGLVTLKVYDILGREVATLVNGQLKPGTYEVDFDGSNFVSGVYYYRITADDFVETKRMILIK